MPINASKITVFGGSQLRPNLHVQDYCDAVKLFYRAGGKDPERDLQCRLPEPVASWISRSWCSEVVSQEFPEKGDVAIVTTPSDDLRSYHINSDKIKRVLGLQPRHTIEDAVRDLCARSATAAFPTA